MGTGEDVIDVNKWEGLGVIPILGIGGAAIRAYIRFEEVLRQAEKVMDLSPKDLASFERRAIASGHPTEYVQRRIDEYSFGARFDSAEFQQAFEQVSKVMDLSPKDLASFEEAALRLNPNNSE